MASRQPPQVAARVGQPVGVVDAQPVDPALGDQGEQHGVGLGEDLLVLDPHPGQRVDVEEPSVVELLVADPPVRQPVELPVEQLGQRQVLGAGPDREHVVEVAQHRLAAGAAGAVEGDLAVGDHLADPPPEHRHQQRALLGGPVDVEPPRVRRGRAVAQHRPQRGVQRRRGRHRHVVGHDVDDDAHAQRRGRVGEPAEALRPAELVVEVAVVDDVVAVGRAGRRLQHGGEVDVRDAEVVQVGQHRGGVVEAELRPQLQPVGPGRDAGRSARQTRGAAPGSTATRR